MQLRGAEDLLHRWNLHTLYLVYCALMLKYFNLGMRVLLTITSGQTMLGRASYERLQSMASDKSCSAAWRLRLMPPPKQEKLA